MKLLKLLMYLVTFNLSRRTSAQYSYPWVFSSSLEESEPLSYIKNNEDEKLIDCKNIEPFVPKNSDAYSHALYAVSQECRDVQLVPKLFTAANAFGYAAEYCFKYGVHCKTMPSGIKPIKYGKNKRVATTALTKTTCVQEGYYQVVKATQTIMTANVSACVAVAILKEDSRLVLLAHINVANIRAHDQYQKKRFDDPFSGIRAFVQSNPQGLKVTLASGSPFNLVYVKTVLEDMGLIDIESYCERQWYQPSQGKLDLVDGGSLMIQRGKVFFIKNAQELKGFFPATPKAIQDTPAILKEHSQTNSSKCYDRRQTVTPKY